MAWQLIEEARAAGIPFRLVVADCVYGESAELEASCSPPSIPYIMGLRPSHGTWQCVEDPAHPPAFTPAEAAARLPVRRLAAHVRYDSHGKELVRYVPNWRWGRAYGPTKGVRLIAATLDPAKPSSPSRPGIWRPRLPLGEASAGAGLRALPLARLDRALL